MKFVDIKKNYTQCVIHTILAGYTQCVYTNVIGKLKKRHNGMKQTREPQEYVWTNDH